MDGASAGQRRALQPSVTTSACLHETARLEAALGELVQHFSQRLQEIEAFPESVRQWHNLVGNLTMERDE
jgi:DNA-binding FadR family transcriptional regulator